MGPVLPVWIPVQSQKPPMKARPRAQLRPPDWRQPARPDPLLCWLRYASASSFVIRPPAPVPLIFERSRLLSLAMRRTSGEDRPCSPISLGAELEAAGAAAGVAVGGVPACFSAGAAATGAPAPAALPPITATTVLISTVLPSGTLMSVNTPAAGAGISASTLSVEISNKGSSRWTVSPTFFSHLVIVPSKIDSPIWGITTFVPAAARRRRRLSTARSIRRNARS